MFQPQPIDPVSADSTEQRIDEAIAKAEQTGVCTACWGKGKACYLGASVTTNTLHHQDRPCRRCDGTGKQIEKPFKIRVLSVDDPEFSAKVAKQQVADLREAIAEIPGRVRDGMESKKAEAFGVAYQICHDILSRL